jgi:hypothetical protein
MKTRDLYGPALDWAVAKVQAYDTRNNFRVWVTQDNEQIVFDCYADDWENAYEQAQNAYPDDHIAATEPIDPYNPSTDWAQGGPIIEREGITTSKEDGHWSAYFRDNLFEEDGSEHWSVGETPLIAAMRCYVASKLGDEIDIPEEML